MSTLSAAWKRPAVTENRIDQEEKVICPAFRAGKRPREARTRFTLGPLTPAVQRNPSQEIAHSAVFCRLQHKKPVLGHELVSRHPAGVSQQSLGEDLFEGIVVLRFVKKLQPGHCPCSKRDISHPLRLHDSILP